MDSAPLACETPPQAIAKRTGTHPQRSTAYAQAVQIQRQLHAAAMDKSTSAASLAQVGRAFAELEKLKRLMKMKPAPKDIDVQVKPKMPRGPQAPTWTEAA